jgi:hypothetical protein
MLKYFSVRVLGKMVKSTKIFQQIMDVVVVEKV